LKIDNEIKLRLNATKARYYDENIDGKIPGLRKAAGK